MIGIWVTTSQGRIEAAAYHAARCLADPIHALVNDTEVAKRVATWAGICQVTVIPDAQRPDVLCDAWAQMASQCRLWVVADTPLGQRIVPRLAERLAAPALTNVCALDAAGLTRHAYTGQVMARHDWPQAPLCLLVVQACAFKGQCVESTKAPIDRMTAPKRTWPMHWLSAKPVRSTVTDAEIMIVVGRGVGSQRGVHQWQGFAKRIGAHMGATRAVVDAGWAPFAQQVGQTGRVVAPDLYIGVGVSGSIQHQAGMRHSRTIMAINTDPKAPIFKLADIGCVCDWRQALAIWEAKLEASSFSSSTDVEAQV